MPRSGVLREGTGEDYGPIAVGLTRPIDTVSRIARGTVGAEGGIGISDIPQALEETRAALRHTIREKPAQLLADVAGLVSGGAGTAARAATAGSRTARVAGAVQRGANFVDPAARIAQAGGAVLRPVARHAGNTAALGFGLATGRDPGALREAYEAGRRGGASGKAFRGSLRGQEPLDTVVGDVRQGLDDQRRNINQGVAGLRDKFGTKGERRGPLAEEAQVVDVYESQQARRDFEEIFGRKLSESSFGAAAEEAGAQGAADYARSNEAVYSRGELLSRAAQGDPGALEALSYRVSRADTFRANAVKARAAKAQKAREQAATGKVSDAAGTMLGDEAAAWVKQSAPPGSKQAAILASVFKGMQPEDAAKVVEDLRARDGGLESGLADQDAAILKDIDAEIAAKFGPTLSKLGLTSGKLFGRGVAALLKGTANVGMKGTGALLGALWHQAKRPNIRRSRTQQEAVRAQAGLSQGGFTGSLLGTQVAGSLGKNRKFIGSRGASSSILGGGARAYLDRNKAQGRGFQLRGSLGPFNINMRGGRDLGTKTRAALSQGRAVGRGADLAPAAKVLKLAPKGVASLWRGGKNIVRRTGVGRMVRDATALKNTFMPGFYQRMVRRHQLAFGDDARTVGDAKSAARLGPAPDVEKLAQLGGRRIDMSKVALRVGEALKADFGGINLDPTTAGARKQIGAMMEEWGRQSKKDYHTLAGADALLQQMTNMAGGEVHTPLMGHKGRVMVNARNAMRDAIREQAPPEYVGFMDRQDEAFRHLRDAESALSAGSGRSAEEALRKITRVGGTRTGGNATKLRRQYLESLNVPQLAERLAGLELNEWRPRAGGMVGSAAAAMMAPKVLPFLSATSPRVVGEASHALGRLAGSPIARAYKAAYDPRSSAVGGVSNPMLTYAAGRAAESTPEFQDKGDLRRLAELLALAGYGTGKALQGAYGIAHPLLSGAWNAADRGTSAVFDRGYQAGR